MKRILSIIVIAVLVTNARAQQRYYIVQGYVPGHNDLFVVELPSGELEYHLGLDNYESFKDTVHLVLSKEECKEFSKALDKLYVQFARWERIAKINDVKNYVRPFDVEIPPICFEWREYIDDTFSYRVFSERHRSTEKIHIAAYFRVFELSGNKYCTIDLKADIPYASNSVYKFRTSIPSCGWIDSIIHRCDTRWINAKYKKLKPKPKEYYDSLFE